MRAVKLVGMVQKFHSAAVERPHLRITHGLWEARVVFSDALGRQDAPWTMTANCDREGAGMSHWFRAEAHPEGRFPPTEAPATPTMLAAFLEECQRFVAGLEKSPATVPQASA